MSTLLITPVALIATKFAGRTIAGIKGQDEARMWKVGDERWGQVVTEKRLKKMRGDTTADLDRFRSEVLSFASTAAHEQYEAFCEDRLLPEPDDEDRVYFYPDGNNGWVPRVS